MPDQDLKLYLPFNLPLAFLPRGPTICPLYHHRTLTQGSLQCPLRPLRCHLFNKCHRKGLSLHRICIITHLTECLHLYLLSLYDRMPVNTHLLKARMATLMSMVGRNRHLCSLKLRPTDLVLRPTGRVWDTPVAGAFVAVHWAAGSRPVSSSPLEDARMGMCTSR